MTDIFAILLAAGQARRFRAAAPQSASKLLALWRGAPLAAHAADAALAAGLPLTIVTGHAAREVEAALAGRPAHFVHNADFGSGMAGSLRCGVAALPPQARAAVILLGDMPRIGAPLLRGLLGAYMAADPAWAVVPVHAGRRGNPVILGRALFPEVMRLEGDQGARKLLASHPERVREWETDDPAIFFDVDTPDALGALPQA